MSDIVFVHPQNSLRDFFVYASVLRKIRQDNSEPKTIYYFVLEKYAKHLPYLINDLKNITTVNVGSLNPNSLRTFIQFCRKYNTANKECFGENDIFRNDIYKDVHEGMESEYDLMVYGISDDVIFDNFRYFPKHSMKDHAKFIHKFTSNINIVSSTSHLEKLNMKPSGVLVDFSKMFPNEDETFHNCYYLLTKTDTVKSLGNTTFTLFVMFLKYSNQISIGNILLVPDEEQTLMYSDIWNKIK